MAGKRQPSPFTDFPVLIGQRELEEKGNMEQAQSSPGQNTLSPLHYCEWCVNQGGHTYRPPPPPPAASPFSMGAGGLLVTRQHLKEAIPREVLAFAQDTLPDSRRGSEHTVGAKCRCLEN